MTIEPASDELIDKASEIFSDMYLLEKTTEGAESVSKEWHIISSLISRIRKEQEEKEALQEKIENATYAASATQPTWHHRCNKIMAALGFDYGDADWMMPDEKRRLADAEDDIARLQEEKAVMARALEPFANEANEWGQAPRDLGVTISSMLFRRAFDPSHFYSASAALAGSSTIISDMEAEIERLKTAVVEVIEAWESLPEGDYDPREVGRWLNGPMVKGINIARAAIKGPSDA